MQGRVGPATWRPSSCCNGCGADWIVRISVYLREVCAYSRWPRSGPDCDDAAHGCSRGCWPASRSLACRLSRPVGVAASDACQRLLISISLHQHDTIRLFATEVERKLSDMRRARICCCARSWEKIYILFRGRKFIIVIGRTSTRLISRLLAEALLFHV